MEMLSLKSNASKLFDEANKVFSFLIFLLEPVPSFNLTSVSLHYLTFPPSITLILPFRTMLSLFSILFYCLLPLFLFKVLHRSKRDKRAAEVRFAGKWDDVKEASDTFNLLHDDTRSLLRIKFFTDLKLKTQTEVVEVFFDQIDSNVLVLIAFNWK